MKKTPRTIKELLSSPESWTQNTLARDQNGKSKHHDDLSATSWCLMGAILHVYQHADLVTYERVADMCLSKIGPLSLGEWPKCIVRWNDSPERSYKDIVELLESTGI